MKNLMLLFLLLIAGGLYAQDMSYSNSYYADPHITTSVQDKNWAFMKQPVAVSFASTATRYAKDKIPAAGLQKQWQAIAWKGEKIHTQLILWTNKPIEAISLSTSVLQLGKAAIISAENIKAGFVRYVITDEFAGGCGYRKPKDFDSSIVADAIDITNNISAAANTVQPIWLSIQVPADTRPGKYKGTITITADKKYQLPYTVTVIDKTLPPASGWNFQLDLWQHPAAIARVHNVPLWSKEHYERMRPYYTMLAGAGQKCITTSIMNEPWGHQTYDDFPSLVKWIKHKDGSWTYDYSLFDTYVEFVMSCGITKRINCYSMVPWALSFAYFDETTGKDTTLKASIGSAAYYTHWIPMLQNFTIHLKKKGWFDITTIAMDERPMKDLQVVIGLLKAIDSNWKIALAGNYHPEIENDIYDYCVASNLEFPREVLTSRIANNKPSTYYTCCTENYPNGFTFSPPDEHVWLGWYAAAKGFTGYLRWAYNSWVARPLTDSRFTAWPAGDTYQVYPGPRSSIRFEKMTEGIQDFEKIRLLRDLYTKNGDAVRLKKLNDALAGFEIGKLKTQTASQMLRDVKPLLNQ